MKILIFVPTLSGGGAERVAANLANHWSNQGRQVTVVTIAAQSPDSYPLQSRVKFIGMDLTHQSGSRFSAIRNNLRRVKALRNILVTMRPEVVLSVMTDANILLALASLGVGGVTPIGSEHVALPPSRRRGLAREKLRRWSYKRLASVVALTRASGDWLENNTQAQSVVVIPNSITLPVGTSEPMVSPNSIGDRGKRRLLAAGRLVNQKGFDLTIGAFARLAARFPDWELVILGDGRMRRALEAQIAELDIGDRVFLPGRVGNPGDWYAAANIFVMSSRREGFPMVLLEAMAHGLPAVSLDCTGARDIIRHGVDGLLVSPETPGGLAPAMETLMGDAHTRLQFATRAVEVRDRFSFDRVGKLWDDLFASVRRR